jgi:uncharacterized protein involved in exopolysaccharide biosynthesis
MAKELYRAQLQPLDSPRFWTIRDLVAIGFSHRRLVITSFSVLLLLAVAAALLLPARYEAEMELLVKMRRMDPIVSPGLVVSQTNNETVTEEQINSEIELLKSDDVLRSVVVANHLQRSKSKWPWHKNTSEDEAVSKAASALKNGLLVTPIRKTNLISVRYRSSDPQLAAAVLRSVANAYLQKKMELDQLGAQYEFFKQQAEEYKKELANEQAKLESNGGVAPDKARDNMLQKTSDFQASLGQTQAAIRETEQRINVLQREEHTIPSRLTTQVRRADNVQLLQRLKGTLVDMQLKRVELLTKYQPGYRLVQELDSKIADAKAAIAREENRPPRDETTDQNPASVWVRSELAKAQADLVGLRGRAASTENTIAELQADAKQLNQQGIVNQNLARAVKTAEDNYLLYVRKREEARISEALDRNRILNVVLAEEARPPVMPVYSRLSLVGIGLLMAMFLSSGLVFAAEWLNPFYRTPHEVAALLELPVLAALPHPAETLAGRNGTGAARHVDDATPEHEQSNGQTGT